MTDILLGNQGTTYVTSPQRVARQCQFDNVGAWYASIVTAIRPASLSLSLHRSVCHMQPDFELLLYHHTLSPCPYCQSTSDATLSSLTNRLPHTFGCAMNLHKSKSNVRFQGRNKKVNEQSKPQAARGLRKLSEGMQMSDSKRHTNAHINRSNSSNLRA
jgi:hypothetical protein